MPSKFEAPSWLRHQLDLEPMTDDQTQLAEDNMEDWCFVVCNEWNRTNRCSRILEYLLLENSVARPAFAFA